MARERTYPVTLTCRELQLVSDALMYYEAACRQDSLDEVSKLYEHFDALHNTAIELEPIT